MKWNLGASRIEVYSIYWAETVGGWLGSKGASQKRPVQKDGGGINKKAGLCSTIKKEAID